MHVRLKHHYFPTLFNPLTKQINRKSECWLQNVCKMYCKKNILRFSVVCLLITMIWHQQMIKIGYVSTPHCYSLLVQNIFTNYWHHIVVNQRSYDAYCDSQPQTTNKTFKHKRKLEFSWMLINFISKVTHTKMYFADHVYVSKNV